MVALDAFAYYSSPAEDARATASLLNERFASWRTRDVLEAVTGEEFPGRVALVSSFGAESVVLLHLVAGVDPATPVIFVDTGKIFPATHRYRDELVEQLGLKNVHLPRPATVPLAKADPFGALWMQDTDACCGVRKVEPLARALEGFDAWISGRKRFQGGERGRLPLVEADGSRIKVNPLAGWSRDDVAAYRRLHDLPEHPLVTDGYASVGCIPCSDRRREGEDERAGRWRGQEKTECGIHLGLATFEAEGSGI